MNDDKIYFVLKFLEENQKNLKCLQINVKNLEDLKKEIKKYNSNSVQCISCEWSIEEINFVLKKYKKALKKLEKENNHVSKYKSTRVFN